MLPFSPHPAERTYRKIPKISPRAYIFQRPFLRSLFTEGNLRFKIDWASLIVGSKFTIFALFYFVFEGNFPSTSPWGAYIWSGDLTEGFLHYEFGGLIFGGAHTWRGLFSEFYGISTYLRFMFVQSHSIDLMLYKFTILTVNACILSGQGANVILDCVGSSFWEQNVKSLAIDSRWILYGLLGGSNVSGELLGHVLKKRVSLIGTTLKSRPLAVSYYSLKY